ncbi:MAG: hypothetical protein GC178_18310 [Flavobacteriales bacterium]|nr:hypothetical protein [Flavobacteriales bacterium]
MLLNIQFLIRRTEFLLHPFTWVIILLIWAVLTYNQKRRKRLMLWALGMLVFFSNSFIVDEFTRVWEMEVTPVWKIDPNVKTAIVLGGGVYYDTETDVVSYGGNADRYLGVLRPYHEHRIQKILVSGGGANYLATDVKESEMLRRLYLLCDVDSADILIEDQSLNTYENAKFCKPILEELGEEKFLLITSAAHMRRAVACFEKQGINVIPHPVMKSVGKRRFELDYLFVPRVMNFHKWMSLIHEWIGVLSYKLRGYI